MPTFNLTQRVNIADNGRWNDANGLGPTSGTDFDPSGIGDAITLDGLTITLVDILAPEFEDDGTGTFVRTGNIITGNTTNISGQDALGINNITIGNTAFDAQSASGNNGGESSDINADESLIFTFDQDVEFTNVELESLSIAKSIESLVKKLPNITGGVNLTVIGVTALITSYFYLRSRQIYNELNIVRHEGGV